MTRRAKIPAGYPLEARLCQRTSGERNPWKPLAFLLCLSCIAAAQPAPAQRLRPEAKRYPDLACKWSAQLTVTRPEVSDRYLVPFDLLIERVPGAWRAALLNGSDRIDFSSIDLRSSALRSNALRSNDPPGTQVTLRLDQYDATLSAHCSSGHPRCDALEGEYVRQKGASILHYPFTAHCPPASPTPEHISASPPHLAPQGFDASDWQFTFTDGPAPAAGSKALPSKPDSEPDAPAHFTQSGSRVEGTIAPISGDYGTLAGELSAGDSGSDAELHLSRFDGIHALRLDARLVSFHDAPARLEGVFHVAPGVALNFVATRSASATGFEESERLTSVANPAEPFRFHGVDASGATVTQSDPRFRGKVVLVDIFGTWCPNCHDEAPVLQSLYAQYHARGLEIVGLSFEYVDDRTRSQRLLRVYRSKYHIDFPLLLSGTTDAGQIAKSLPQLRNFGAYPTTIFLDRHGRVRLIHAGFSGPATGRLDEIQQHFQQTIVKLLDEP